MSFLSIKMSCMTNRWSWREEYGENLLMSFSVRELWLVTREFYWRLSAWHSNRIWCNFHLTVCCIKIFFWFDLCLWRMSVYEISKVLVFVGLRSITVTSSYVQMTRRISKVVIHGGYNAATYVSSTEQFCWAVDAFDLGPKICQYLSILND